MLGNMNQVNRQQQLTEANQQQQADQIMVQMTQKAMRDAMLSYAVLNQIANWMQNGIQNAAVQMPKQPDNQQRNNATAGLRQDQLLQGHPVLAQTSYTDGATPDNNQQIEPAQNTEKAEEFYLEHPDLTPSPELQLQQENSPKLAERKQYSPSQEMINSGPAQS